MKIITVFLLLVIISGCGRMSIDDVIIDIRKCEEAGLVPKPFVSVVNYRTMFIRCDVPIDKKGE